MQDDDDEQGDVGEILQWTLVRLEGLESVVLHG